MQTLRKIDKGLNKAEELLVMVLLSAMVIVVTIQVVNQAFLHLSITWTEEVSRIMLVWSMMIGSSICVNRGAHLTVSFVYDRMKGLLKHIMRILVLLACIAVSAYLIRSGIYLVKNHSAQMLRFGVTRIPLFWASTAIPVGFVLITFRFLLQLIYAFEELFRYKKEDKKEDAAC